jgi:hypothetical protein
MLLPEVAIGQIAFDCHFDPSLQSSAHSKRAPALQDPSRHRWVAAYILPHEGEVRGWLRRHVRTLNGHDVGDLMQEAHARLWTAEYNPCAPAPTT